MKTRIVTALICIPLLVVLLLSGKYIVTAAVAAVSIIGMYEFFRAVGIYEKKALCIFGYAAAVVIPFLHCLAPEMGEYSQNVSRALFFILMLAGFAAMLARHKTITVSDMALLLFAVAYIPFFLSDIINIRLLENGRFYIWLVFIGAFLTDSCAYFSGVFLGKHKLCPAISPKKTIEGALGGILGCVLFFMIYGYIMQKCGIDISFYRLALLGVLVSPISQIGDLTASVIKRTYGIKDYGTLFPGHGGILDRCDSVILVAPTVYLFLITIGIV